MGFTNPTIPTQTDSAAHKSEVEVPMVHAAGQGFLLGFSLILAIGAQNAFVLRQGLRGEHVMTVVLICSFSDAVLIVAGVYAFTNIAVIVPTLVPAMRYGGAAFLFVYGALAFRKAWRWDASLEPAEDIRRPLGAVLGIALTLTWLNPHVYLDTVALIGSISAGFPRHQVAFATGAVAASFVFFFSLGFGARLLQPFFARPASWRMLELGIGGIMWFIAAGLLLG
jgi:L-lysine exporter family protein LysE/ArgO